MSGLIFSLRLWLYDHLSAPEHRWCSEYEDADTIRYWREPLAARPSTKERGSE